MSETRQRAASVPLRRSSRTTDRGHASTFARQQGQHDHVVELGQDIGADFIKRSRAIRMSLSGLGSRIGNDRRPSRHRNAGAPGAGGPTNSARCSTACGVRSDRHLACSRCLGT